ncbi:MAG: S8 family serine peptidase, partial [Chloroflexi bacterium]|nr:S8 family serine peptidase [Chloroflexota bacterium]
YTYDAPSDFVTPEDSEGHGSHTASTVAGNFVDVDFYGTAVTISGVAPHAQIVAYDVCYPTPTGGQCAGEDSVAAVQQAILDGVDVINYSISGGEYPYEDGVELAFLDATAAGVTVSTSAGNSGPDAETVAHRSPWLLSTAATSHNRKFTSVVDFSDPQYQGIFTLAGEIPFTADIVDSPVIYSGEDTGNDLGCNAYPAAFFKDSIALVKRGTCTFSVKINNAAAAGAVGVLVFTDNRAPGPMSVSGTAIPGVMLDIPGTVGDAIAAWVASTADETVSISAFGAQYDDAYADIMADFSSRGPNTTFDVLKPDIAAPGLEILAAVADGLIEPDGETELDLYQGTSMASPHDAGAAALLTALHPDWTPAEIKSALMLTAYDLLLKEDAATAADPFDIGAGRIQLELAGLTGLVMDESITNYEDADPALGGDVKTLNTPSVYNSSCVGECSWTRTFTSVADLPATYTVSAPAWITVIPAEFTINPGASQEVTITADVSTYEPGEWIFGNIEFLTDSTFAGGGDPVALLSEGFEVWPPVGWTIDADPASCDVWLSSETTGEANETGGAGFAAEANSDF